MSWLQFLHFLKCPGFSDQKYVIWHRPLKQGSKKPPTIASLACSTNTRQWLAIVTGTDFVPSDHNQNLWAEKYRESPMGCYESLAQKPLYVWLRQQMREKTEQHLLKRSFTSCFLVCCRQPARRLKSVLKSMRMEIFGFPQTTKLASCNYQSPRIIFCKTEGKSFLKMMWMLNRCSQIRQSLLFWAHFG